MSAHVTAPVRWIVVLLIIAVAVPIALSARTGTASAASTGVVINEVYGGGGNSGATYENDFIELRNLSSAAVDLSTYAVQYASASGSFTTGSPSYQTNLSGTIPAGGLYLIQEAAGAATGDTALPTPQATGTINLSGTNGKVALLNSQSVAASGPGGTDVVDFVGYGTANQSETAPAPALSNATSAQRTGADTDDNASDFIAAAPTPGAANQTGGTSPSCPLGSGTPGPAIDTITSDSWLSPDDGDTVTNVPGIVTGIRTSGSSKGFWIQAPTAADTDPATSEGLFVYTSSAPSSCIAVGDSVLVSGTVDNYDPEGSRASTTTDDLTVTELDSPTTTVLSTGNALPAPIVIGPNTVPATYAPDLSGTADDDIEDTPITPTRSALDFWRSIEGMRVEVDNARVVGPSAVFGSGSTQDSESYITTKPSEAETFRGGTELLGENEMPAGRVELVPDDGSNPALSVGDVLTGATIGTIDYSDYGGFVIASTQLGTTDRTNQVTPTVVSPAPSGQLSIATYNVENLAPSDPASKFTALGQDLVTNLGSPDIVAVEEVQDNDGETDDGVVSATQTIAMLEQAIVAAGGPQYAAEEIDPVNDQDGGAPGGNIRVVYLYNPAAVSFVPGTDGAGDATTATAVTSVNGQPALTLSPGRIDPTNSAWASSRKPLVGEFMFGGKPVFVIANHFVAKLGDQDQDGRYQYPAQSSETQREAQATEVHTFAQQILSVNPSANVVVLGDLNDYQFSPALKTLETGNADGSGTSILQDLITTLPVNQQYTYDYEGVSEVLDHILVSPSLQGHTTYQVAHINSEFTAQTSDHDPQVVDLALPAAASPTGTPTTGTTTTGTTSTPTPSTPSAPTPTPPPAAGIYTESPGSSSTATGASIRLSASFGSAAHPLTSLKIAPSFGAGVKKVVYTLNRQVICSDVRAPFACNAKLTGADPGLARLVITVTATNGKVTSLNRVIHIARIAVKALTLRSRVSRGRLLVSGKLTLPSNVTARQGCEAGTVRVGAPKRVIRVKLTRRCTYSATLNAVRRGTALTATFSGNRALEPRSTRARAA